jgi:hypothetical protein
MGGQSADWASSTEIPLGNAPYSALAWGYYYLSPIEYWPMVGMDVAIDFCQIGCHLMFL